MSNRKALTIIGVMFAITLALSIWKDYGRCKDVKAVDTVIVERIDTQYIMKTDTVPVARYITKIKEVRVPVTIKDSDSITFPVIQKEYTDDSTYIAYVSGLACQDMPKLDSITVRQREITRMVDKVITVRERQHWSFGITAGAGVGVISRKPDVFIGFGVMYSF